MKLLFDQNLSPRLVNRLADTYPDSDHVFQIGLARADERILWQYARHIPQLWILSLYRFYPVLKIFLNLALFGN